MNQVAKFYLATQWEGADILLTYLRAISADGPSTPGRRKCPQHKSVNKLDAINITGLGLQLLISHA